MSEIKYGGQKVFNRRRIAYALPIETWYSLLYDSVWMKHSQMVLNNSLSSHSVELDLNETSTLKDCNFINRMIFKDLNYNSYYSQLWLPDIETINVSISSFAMCMLVCMPVKLSEFWLIYYYTITYLLTCFVSPNAHEPKMCYRPNNKFIVRLNPLVPVVICWIVHASLIKWNYKHEWDKFLIC